MNPASSSRDTRAYFARAYEASHPGALEKDFQNAWKSPDFKEQREVCALGEPRIEHFIDHWHEIRIGCRRRICSFSQCQSKEENWEKVRPFEEDM
jgi:hypothetical protein